MGPDAECKGIPVPEFESRTHHRITYKINGRRYAARTSYVQDKERRYLPLRHLGLDSGKDLNGNVYYEYSDSRPSA